MNGPNWRGDKHWRGNMNRHGFGGQRSDNDRSESANWRDDALRSKGDSPLRETDRRVDKNLRGDMKRRGVNDRYGDCGLRSDNGRSESGNWRDDTLISKVLDSGSKDTSDNGKMKVRDEINPANVQRKLKVQGHPVEEPEIKSAISPIPNFDDLQLDNSRVQQKSINEVRETSDSKTSVDISCLVECPICFGILNEPKTLSCEHSFCKECIEEIVKFNGNCVPFIKCPICCSNHYLPKGQTVSSMKAPLVLKQMIDQSIDQVAKNSGRDLHDNAAESIFRCCRNTLSFYCGKCDVFLCKECVQLHLKKGCDPKTVRFCKSKNEMLPFCGRHGSFAYAACKTCVGVACPYCKEEMHKYHSTVSLDEYSSIFRTSLTTRIQPCKKYLESMSEIISTPCNNLAGIRKLMAERKIVMLSKYLYLLENVCETQMRDLQEMKGNIVSQGDWWRSKQSICKKTLDTAESLEKKGNVEIMWNIPTVLKGISSNFPAQMDVGDWVTQLKAGDGSANSRLLEYITHEFGVLDIPCLDTAGNVNMVSVNHCQTEVSSLLPELSEMNEYSAARQYIKETMQQLP